MCLLIGETMLASLYKPDDIDRSKSSRANGNRKSSGEEFSRYGLTVRTEHSVLYHFDPEIFLE